MLPSEITESFAVKFNFVSFYSASNMDFKLILSQGIHTLTESDNANLKLIKAFYNTKKNMYIKATFIYILRKKTI